MKTKPTTPKTKQQTVTTTASPLPSTTKTRPIPVATAATTTAVASDMFSPSRSQDSFMDRLSPDTSDTGDHSAETETEPHEVDIKKGTAPLGKYITYIIYIYIYRERERERLTILCIAIKINVEAYSIITSYLLTYQST